MLTAEAQYVMNKLAVHFLYSVFSQKILGS